VSDPLPLQLRSMLADRTHRMDSEAVAEDFVRARLNAEALLDFPGPIPTTLNTAYAYQDRAMALWPDHVAGWKVGRIGPPWLERVGEDRLVGPIFRRGIRLAPPEAVIEFPVFKGGFAAIEAEFVFRLGADAEPDKTLWTADEAAQLISTVHVGIETAGSPLAAINELGPTVVVSDFGNNTGLLLGPAFADWRRRPLEALTCEAFIGTARRPARRGGFRVGALRPPRPAHEVRLCHFHRRRHRHPRHPHRAERPRAFRRHRGDPVSGRAGGQSHTNVRHSSDGRRCAARARLR
jgi:2-keto-4-pentenoate hydratase